MIYNLLSGDSGVLAGIVLALLGGIPYAFSRLKLNRKYYKKVIILFLSNVLCEITFIKSIPTYRKIMSEYIYETMEFGKNYRKFKKHHKEKEM